jgi:RNA polymerase sigma-70 factor (ECF subfamily)
MDRVAADEDHARELERHRLELTRYCRRMLGSAFEAEDAVQDTLVRAWRGFDRLERRATLRSWLYRIATNVCLDMLNARARRARPMDLGTALSPEGPTGGELPPPSWIEPLSARLVAEGDDPAEAAAARETVRLAFVAALRHLSPRQRAALILCEVLRWKASEAAELLEASVASVTSALQRARATLARKDVSAADAATSLDASDRELLARYVDAFERDDVEGLARALAAGAGVG